MSVQHSEIASLVASHVEEDGEESLSRAYELGRRALTEGAGVLDILALQDAAYRELVLKAAPERQAHVAASVQEFFREMLSPFEMSFRGYRDANSELLRMNRELRAAYAELQTKQAQLIQSAKMASLGELVAGVAHEINNPLAFVISHLDTARRSLKQVSPMVPEHVVQTQDWQRASSRLEEMSIGLERIRDLVLKLRTFSRLDEGERKVVSVRGCVEALLTILGHLLGGRIQLETFFGEPDEIECFPALLSQALMNLTTNAIDAIEGSGKIAISTGADGDDYVISISDTGNGIPAEIRARVLEPFFTTKPLGKGTGLGLSITHSIVETHGGTLELAERHGGGTVVTIRLPLLGPDRAGRKSASLRPRHSGSG